jgi:thymidylate synthase (FAD)
MKINVLDKGFVDCQEVFGDELTVVNCARVSFGKQKTVMDEDDLRLLRYLIKNKHFSPFRHVMFRFHIKAPEFVMRQWYKHIIGAEWSSAGAYAPFHAWNEISGRYVPLTEFYVPDQWRKQSTNSKQGSSGFFETDNEFAPQYNEYIDQMSKLYNSFIELGVAKEQARILLPLSVYTETIWTCSFQAVMNFLELRLDPHAQLEIQEFAKAIEEIVVAHMPNVVEVWNKGA